MGIAKGTKIERGIHIDYEDFKEKFTKYRGYKGLTIESACIEIGISSTIYQRILQGKKVDPKTIGKMSKHIKIKIL